SGRRLSDHIEVLGGYLVAFGDHPKTGKPYRWGPDGNPATTRASELPTVDRTSLDGFIKSFGVAANARSAQRGSAKPQSITLDPQGIEVPEGSGRLTWV